MRSLLFLILVVMPAAVNAAEYNIEELQSETATVAKPFSITQVEQQRGELRLFIQAGNIAQIQRLISSGTLAAQFSEGENAMTVPLSLSKAVTCDTGTTYHLGYSAPMPDCTISQIRYYLRTPVTLGQGRDLAIGIDPDFIWIIEQK
jgi:hypothetical protein